MFDYHYGTLMGCVGATQLIRNELHRREKPPRLAYHIRFYTRVKFSVDELTIIVVLPTDALPGMSDQQHTVNLLLPINALASAHNDAAYHHHPLGSGKRWSILSLHM